MKVLFPILLIVLCLYTVAAAQTKEVPVHYYFSTDDFVWNNLSIEEIILEVKSMGTQFIFIKEVRDQFTGKRSERGTSAWQLNMMAIGI